MSVKQRKASVRADGERIRELRYQQAHTQESLVASAGGAFSIETYRRAERSERISVEKLHAIARVLGVEASEISAGKGEDQSKHQKSNKTEKYPYVDYKLHFPTRDEVAEYDDNTRKLIDHIKNYRLYKMCQPRHFYGKNFGGSEYLNYMLSKLKNI